MLPNETRYERLNFRRQFIAGPRGMPLEPWNSLRCCGGLHVTSHPDLLVTRASEGRRTLVCLGHVLDPDEPDRQNGEILDVILRNTSSFADFEAQVVKLGGRWLIFVTIDGQCRLYPDPWATKSVFYVNSPVRDEFWVGSQPSLFGDLLGILRDEALEASFHRHPIGYSWPVTTTPYQGTYKLLPNHYLDMATRRQVRFWPSPSFRRRTQSPETAAKRMSELLRGIIDSVSRRGHPCMTLTGGYDTRLMFASAGSVRERMFFFSVVLPTTPWCDYVIPKALAKKFGLTISTIHARPLDRSFVEVMDANTAGLFWDPNKSMIRTFGVVPEGGFLLSGLGGAMRLPKRYLSRAAKKEAQNHDASTEHPDALEVARWLAHLEDCEANPVALRGFAEWFSALPRQMDVDLVDLFYWEQRLGNWGSIGCTAIDTVCEHIPAFNCRELLEAALCVEKYQRDNLYRIVMQDLAPAALSLPFSTTFRDRIAGRVNNMLPWRIRHAVTTRRMRAAGLMID
jgi:hypothetical protein